jgi:hypothetical protein
MANLRAKGRSKEHIGLDNREALAAFLGKPYKKPRSPAAGKGDNRRPEDPKHGCYSENYDQVDWSK